MRFGPGEYVPDPTERIIDISDLPAPQIVMEWTLPLVNSAPNGP